MSDFDEGRGGGEVVIVAATHPTPPVSNSGGTQGQGMPFFTHKGKKEIQPYLNILIYKCLAIRPRGTKIKETNLKRRK